ncbi:N-6 DNA methylase [Apilactobacillus kunkeei]|nr:N-6 DNA methylase [Apilactobacillus kunkeei]
MAIIEYEDEIKELVNRDNHDEFIYDFLSIYDKISKATITKLRKGTNNLAKTQGEVYLKNKLYFKYTDNDVLGAFSQVETYVNEISSKPRYIIVTDYERLLAKDTKTKDSLDIEFTQLPKYFEFFLAWNGIEKADFEKENPADIKAAEYFARIYDQLLEDNENVSRHGFNLFLIRLLFCLFAEDTGIFKENSFTDFLKMMTSDDGSDMNERISELFTFLDKKVRSGNEPAYLLEFPYVNGQLFTDSHENIIFSNMTRKSIIDAGELIGWSKVNPDILGSMIQSVATEDKRSHFGMHYTSVPNIMKVIKPLFLDDLYDELNKSRGHEDKLNRLYNRIGNINFMDPACGSGNFLIITYKALRNIEIEIIKELNHMGIPTMYVPSVTLDQFFGIEIEDFSCEVTRLSLWIAEHQMNKKLEEEIDNAVRPTLPLQKCGAIVNENALRVNWKDILPNDDLKDEIYVFGNPPYINEKLEESQKEDKRRLFKGVSGFKSLDYVSCWFIKAADYIFNTDCKFAFVTTNSIYQGTQVAPLTEALSQYGVYPFLLIIHLNGRIVQKITQW